MFLSDICSHNCISNLNKPGCDDQIHLFLNVHYGHRSTYQTNGQRDCGFVSSFFQKEHKQLSMMKLTLSPFGKLVDNPYYHGILC